MDRAYLIEKARRARGLTQVQLAARAGTSQATLSAYERGLKSPSLKVASRILAATGHELTLRTYVDWTEHQAPGIDDFSVPDRLWAVAPPMCFATITMMPDLIGGSGKDEWNLLDRADRIGAYEQLIRCGLPHQMIRWIDGGLLVDVWGELDLPDPVRTAWEPAIRAATEAPRDDALRFMGGTPWIAASARIGSTNRLPPPPAASPPRPSAPPRRSRFDPRPPPT